MLSGMLQLGLPLIMAGLGFGLCALMLSLPAAVGLVRQVWIGRGSLPLVSGRQQYMLPCCCLAHLVPAGAQVQPDTLLMLPPLALTSTQILQRPPLVHQAASSGCHAAGLRGNGLMLLNMAP